MLRRIRTRLGTALLTGPLALSAAVPVALAMTEPPAPLRSVGLLSESLGPGDGLDRYVVTVGRDLPPRSGSGWRQGSASGTPTYDENLAALQGFPGVEIVQPLGGNRALVAVQDGTSARTLPFVRSAERAPTGTWAAAAVPDDPFFSYSWDLRNTGRHALMTSAQVAGADVDALTAWEHAKGEGVVVAVVDNGVDITHQDLAGSVWTNPDEGCDPNVDRDRNGLRGDCHGWNFYRNSPDVANLVDGRSMADHGTPVASTIAAGISNGVGTTGLAPQAKIMPVVIGGGHELQTSHIAPAIRYAVDNGADIINMSFGVNGDVTEIRQAIAYAAQRGVLMVAAAGNSGGLDRDVQRSWPVSYSLPQLIGVGSSNAADGIASHSDVGATTVHLFAPGQDIAAAFPGDQYARAHGTSFASPITAAAAALVMAARPDLSAAAVKDHLVRTVEQLPAMAGRSVSGGRLDAGRALATLAAPAQVSVDGLAGLRARTAGTATVRLTGTGDGLPAGELALRVSLAAFQDGALLAVADHPVDAGTAGAGRTGQDGSLLLRPAGLTAAAIADDVAVPLTTTLPQGRYGLVAQLVTATGAAVTPPQAVAFTVRPQSPGDSGAGGAGGGTDPSPGDGGSPVDGGTPVGGGTPDGGSGDGGTPDTGPVDGGAGDGGDAGTGGGDTPAGEVPGGGPGGGGDAVDGSTGDGGGQDSGSGGQDGGAGGTDGDGSAPDDGPAGGSPVEDGPGQVPAGDSPPEQGAGSDGPVRDGAPAQCDEATVAPTQHFAITSLTPTCGDLGGGTSVTIRGTALPRGALVMIGGEPARVLSDDAPRSVTVSTPRRYNAGAFDVAVFSPQRVSDVLTGAFTYHDGQAGTDTPPGQDGTPGDGGTGDGGDGGSGGGSDDGGTPDDGTATGPGDGTTGGGTPDGGTPDSGTGDGGAGHGGAGEDGSAAPSPGSPAGDPADFEGLTLVDTGGSVGGLTAAGMALLGDCGTSCFATKL